MLGGRGGPGQQHLCLPACAACSWRTLEPLRRTTLEPRVPDQSRVLHPLAGYGNPLKVVWRIFILPVLLPLMFAQPERRHRDGIRACLEWAISVIGVG